MAILLLHLSDIHISKASDPILGRVLAIKQAILATHPTAEACIIIVSGDVADKGQVSEYGLAATFINELRSTLQTSGVAQVGVVVIPGNHDLDLTEEVDVRTEILESPEKYVSKPIDFNGLMYASIISVQSNFFAFEAAASRSVPVHDRDRLYYTKDFNTKDRILRFHCFNTAWLSRRHEQQSKLFIPAEVLVPYAGPSPDLSIALFHHPFNWLNHANYRSLKSFVENTADIALTGHEHVAGFSRQNGGKGDAMDYIQGAALQDHETQASAFQLLAIDFDSTEQQLTQYTWNGSRYTATESTTWILRRNEARGQDLLQPSPSFVKLLHSMGTGFRHPRCVPPCELRLRDLYVYPTLRHNSLNRGLGSDAKSSVDVPGDLLHSFVAEKKRVVIYGADDSGKSALARILCDDLLGDKRLPLLLGGDQIRGKPRIRQFDELLKSAIAEQYSSHSVEPYLQSEKKLRFLIIDDFDKARLTSPNQQQLVAHIESIFDVVVFFASDLLQLQHMAGRRDQSQFHGFEFCNIKEFGKYHRQKLIHKWIYFGREDTDEYESLGRSVADLDKPLSTLLGNNVLPHYPVTILTLLQLFESSHTTHTANGSYGYLYEVLIKSAFAGVGQGVSDIDAKITYLSGVGFSMFKHRRTHLTRDEFRLAHNLYCERYDMDREMSQMLAEMLSSELIVDANETLSFKYPYIYYYAVAKYFQENASELRQELSNIVEYLYNETNANILIFYVYLTKDLELIRQVVASAKRIYEEYEPCNMDGDVSVINKLFRLDPPPLTLNVASPAENRDTNNLKQDMEREQSGDEPNGGDVKYDSDLDELVKLQIAFKTLQILGQVLRNFTGSLPGDLKQEITAECFSLGMRVLSFILISTEGDLEEVRAYIGSLIAERTSINDGAELATRADIAILWLSGVAAFGCIKRISYAVGHADLSKTYVKVMADHDDLGTAMIDASIKLDNFKRVPYRELESVQQRMKSNKFAYAVMRDIVADHLYLYGNTQQTIQKLSDGWGIAVSTTKLLVNTSKK